MNFYNDYNYERALKFLEWAANLVHTNDSFRNVGMLEVVNEPTNGPSQAESLRTKYYPQAFQVCSFFERRNKKVIDEIFHIK